MTFLNPMLIGFGAVSVSVPIIIHLLNKRKFERVQWAAMRFLRLSVEQNQRRIQIEDILLLLIRCAMLLLLGLALARPASNSKAPGMLGQAKVTGVIILDNSYSMSGTDGVRSRFDLAKSAAQQVVHSLPNGSAAAVFLASDVTNKPIPQPTHDTTLILKTIQEAKLTDRGTNLAVSLRAAIDTLKHGATFGKEIYLFTDHQALGWRRFSEIQQMLADAARPGSDIRAHLVFVGSAEEQNLGVTSLVLGSDIPTVGRPLRYEVQVQNFGRGEARDVVVKLHMDNDPPCDDVTINSLAPGATKSVFLHAKLRDAGYHSVTASVQPDHLPADDSRTIVVRGIERLKVLLMDGNPGRRPQESETWFLRNILMAVPAALADKHYIQVTTAVAGQLDTTRFDDYDVIAVADVADFSTATLESFASYLRRGRGGLMFFPGPNTQTTFYNDMLFKKYRFLPASLGTPRGNPEQDSAYFTLQSQRFDHPISNIWTDEKAGTPSSAHFFRAYELIPDAAPPATAAAAASTDAPGSEAGQPRVILRFGKGTGDSSLDNKPAVMERSWGLGRVVLFSSTASTRWNDMPVRLAYGTLVHRTLGYIVAQQDEALNIRCGDKFSYHVNDDLLGKDLYFYKPGQDYSTDARHVELLKNVPTISYGQSDSYGDQTDVAGEYRAVIGEPRPNDAARAGQNRRNIIKFAVQADPSESSLDAIGKEQLDLLAKVAHVVQWTPGESLEESITQERTGAEWWFPLACIVVALATFETLLAHWFSRAK